MGESAEIRAPDVKRAREGAGWVGGWVGGWEGCFGDGDGDFGTLWPVNYVGRLRGFLFVFRFFSFLGFFVFGFALHTHTQKQKKK